jgi:glycosyltransferase involved in cell wall biosynthesis
MEPIWTRPAGGLSGQHPVLFVGHDAQLAGSQTLLKEMLRLAGEIPAIDSMLLLLGGGTLEPAYRRLATTCSLGSLVDGGLSAAEAIEACLDSIPNQPEAVVCNTVLSSQATQACRRRGLPVIQLINELPTTVHANGWDQHVIDIASAARRMVFVSDFSRRAFLADFSLDAQQCEVVHPGWLEHDRGQRDGDRSRRTIRRELGIPAESMIVLGCGHIHPRKGVDLFLQVARQVLASPDMQSAHFVWIGDGDHRDRQWIEHDRSLLEHQERIHLLGSRHEINRWFDGADLYLLSSREDPYPIVCVQSMAAGVPVLAFANAGGAAEAIHEGTGVVVPFLDTQAMSSAICDLLGDAAARTTMGQAARALAEARLSSHHHFSGILDIVASTCGVDVRAQR